MDPAARIKELEARIAADAAAKASERLTRLAALKCPICLVTTLEPTVAPCQHVFCLPCLTKVIDQHHQCSVCRAPFARNLTATLVVNPGLRDETRTLRHATADHFMHEAARLLSLPAIPHNALVAARDAVMLCLDTDQGGMFAITARSARDHILVPAILAAPPIEKIMMLPLMTEKPWPVIAVETIAAVAGGGPGSDTLLHDACQALMQHPKWDEWNFVTTTPLLFPVSDTDKFTRAITAYAASATALAEALAWASPQTRRAVENIMCSYASLHDEHMEALSAACEAVRTAQPKRTIARLPQAPPASSGVGLQPPVLARHNAIVASNVFSGAEHVSGSGRGATSNTGPVRGPLVPADGAQRQPVDGVREDDDNTPRADDDSEDTESGDEGDDNRYVQAAIAASLAQEAPAPDPTAALHALHSALQQAAETADAALRDLAQDSEDEGGRL